MYEEYEDYFFETFYGVAEICKEKDVFERIEFGYKEMCYSMNQKNYMYAYIDTKDEKVKYKGGDL